MNRYREILKKPAGGTIVTDTFAASEETIAVFIKNESDETLTFTLEAGCKFDNNEWIALNEPGGSTPITISSTTATTSCTLFSGVPSGVDLRFSCATATAEGNITVKIVC